MDIEQMMLALDLRYNENGEVYFRIYSPTKGKITGLLDEDLEHCVLLTIEEVKDALLNAQDAEYMTAKLTLWKATK